MIGGKFMPEVTENHMNHLFNRKALSANRQKCMETTNEIAPMDTYISKGNREIALRITTLAIMIYGDSNKLTLFQYSFPADKWNGTAVLL